MYYTSASAREESIMEKIKNTVLVILILSIQPTTAFAYVDPGSGTFILQLIAAIGVGALFYFRQLLDKIKSFFAPDKDKPEDKD